MALSKNRGRNIRFRQRIQEDKEREQELKEFMKYKDTDAGTTI